MPLWPATSDPQLITLQSIHKKGNKIIALYKTEISSDYKKIGEYSNDWLNEKVQFGLAICAGIPGDGPKMQPDMKAMFSQIKIKTQ